MFRTAWLLALALSAGSGFAQVWQDYAVQLGATVSDSPPAIVLSWTQATFVPAGYSVYRRLFGSVGSWTWTPVAAGLSGSTLSFTDTNVAPSVTYEYKVTRTDVESAMTGYICATLTPLPEKEDRGAVILCVATNLAVPLAAEIARLQRDLVGDGWTVIPLVTPVVRWNQAGYAAAVTNLKEEIRSIYLADTNRVKSVFFLGFTPTAQSGLATPDGHADHYGAWPCDEYFADMRGTWTDSTCNYTGGGGYLDNVPGDGKFDQTSIPLDADLALAVGRVDLTRLPAFEPLSETDLIRRYLAKDHAYRCALFSVPRRGLVEDDYNYSEAFGASGLRSFAALCGPTNVLTGTKNHIWQTTLPTQAYLFADGAVGPGSQPTAQDFAATPFWTVFTVIFGSYKGDWLRLNCEMVAPLANDGYELTCAWEGRPHWFKHQMALGETIGYCALRTQRNGATSDYAPNYGSSAIHVALMGDPTLRMDVVPPPASASATTNAGGADVTWEASPDGAVAGYHVYRADSLGGPYSRLDANLVSGTNFTDSSARTGDVHYMVRAAKLETGPSGACAYTNLSQGAFTRLTLGGIANHAPAADSMTVTGAEDHAVEITLSGSDMEADALSFFKLPGPLVGTVTGTPPNLVYQPFADWNGTDSFTFVADDGLADSRVATVTVVVAAVNDVPLAQGQSVAALKNTDKAITLAATDVEGDPLTYSLATSPSHGLLSGTPPNVTYTPATDYSGLDSFTFTVSDGQATSLPATVSITVGQTPWLMYEGFDYPLGGSLNAQAGGSGWGAANAWQSNEDGNDTKIAIVAGLTFSNYWVSGNAVQFYNKLNSSALRAGRQVGSGVTNGNVWMSYLYKVEMPRTTAQQYSGVQNMATVFASGSQRMRSLSQYRYGSGAYGAGGVANSTADSGADTSYPGTGTYLLIARFTGVDGVNDGNETGTWWAVTETGYNSIMSNGGMTEANLSAYAFSTATSTSPIGYLFTTSRFVQMFAINYTTNTAYTETFDELRYATALANLFPAAEAPFPDADGDGMDDNWEIANFGSTNAVKGGASEDWDGDGFVNHDEFIAGTSPTNDASKLVLTQMAAPAGGDIVVAWDSVTGRWYTVQWSVALSPATWSNCVGGIDVPGAGGTMAWTSAPTAGTNTFFRVRAQWP